MPRFFLTCFILSVTFSNFSFAQTVSKDELWLAPVCKPKLYGLNDNKGGIAIVPKYDFMMEQKENSWIVKTKNKYGVINSKGEWLIKPKFENITQYFRGKAVAGKKVKKTSSSNRYSYDYNYSDSVVSFGIIDESGAWVIDATYSWLYLCEDGTIEYQDDVENKYGFLNPDGTTLIHAQYDYASPMSNGAAVMGEPSSTTNYPPAYDYDFGNRKHFHAGNYFLIDHSGKKLNENAYDLIRNFSEGLAAFNKGGIWKQKRYDYNSSKLLGGKWGFLDEKGNEVVAAKYDYVYDFEDGKAKVRLGEKTFWIDKNGNETSPPDAKIKAFTIYCEKGFYGFIDQTGKWIIEPQFFYANDFSEGLAAAAPLRASDLNCDDNANGNGVDDLQTYFVPGSDLMGFGSGLEELNEREKMVADSIAKADMYRRRLYGYVDATGNFSIPAKYETAYPFHEGRAYVCFRGKWGVIDKKGDWILAPILESPKELEANRQYERLQMLDYKRQHSKRNQYYGDDVVTNYNGGNNYYNTNNPYDLFNFSEGMGGIYKYEKFGFIDTTGKIIVPPIYDAELPFSQGLAAVKHNDKWGFIDKTGKEVIPFIFHDASSFTIDGLAAVSNVPGTNAQDATDVEVAYESDRSIYYGYIDKTGKWIIKPQFVFAGDFSEGLAGASLSYGSRGYIDKTGKFIIPAKYQDAYAFENGFAKVKIRMFEPVYIDKTGKVSKIYSDKNPPKDKTTLFFRNADDDQMVGYVNGKGEEIVPHIYHDAGSFVRVK
jgi:hypothetical protein